MLLSNSRAISAALLNEADQAQACALMTYNFSGRQSEHLIRWRNLRLIMGVSPEDERSIRSSGRLQGFANISPQAQVRILPNSHVKLAVFWTSSRRNKLRAILSTMNGTAPSDFWELGYIITGTGARELAKFFENRWLEAKPVKSLDLASIRTVLESGVFEGMSAP